MRPLIWIIDEEFSDYDLEISVFKEKFPDFDLRISSYDFSRDLEEFGPEADAVLAQVHAPLTREVINRLTRCKVISVCGSGFDRVDVAAAKARGIAVTNVPDYCKEDIADYVMAAIYFFNKRVGELSARVTNDPWGAQAVPTPPRRLNKCILHIMGFGRIGRAVARKALANGLSVTAYDPFVPKGAMDDLNVDKVEWADGLQKADFVSVHFALTPQTANAVKYQDLGLMKPTAYLINASRGEVIDENGLVKALTEKRIAGAMLDVVANEPPSYKEPIFHCPGAFITPHVSYISKQSYRELRELAADNLVQVLSGAGSRSIVNA